MNLLKKISIIPLLLLTIIPLVYSIFFLLQQHRIRQAVLKKLEIENLQIITLAKTDVTWIKEGEEIKLGDDLFDVKEWKESNGLIMLKGIYDKEEGELYNQLTKMTNTSNGCSSSENIIAKVFVELIGISNHFPWELNPLSPSVTKHFTINEKSVPQITITVFTPPPQV